MNMVNAGTCPEGIGTCNEGIPFENKLPTTSITFNNNTFGANVSGAYVPYSGATADVDLGSHNLETTGDIIGHSFTINGDIFVGAGLVYDSGTGGWNFQGTEVDGVSQLDVGTIRATSGSTGFVTINDALWDYASDINIGSGYNFYVDGGMGAGFPTAQGYDFTMDRWRMNVISTDTIESRAYGDEVFDFLTNPEYVQVGRNIDATGKNLLLKNINLTGDIRSAGYGRIYNGAINQWTFLGSDLSGVDDVYCSNIMASSTSAGSIDVYDTKIDFTGVDVTMSLGLNVTKQVRAREINTTVLNSTFIKSVNGNFTSDVNVSRNLTSKDYVGGNYYGIQGSTSPQVELGSPTSTAIRGRFWYDNNNGDVFLDNKYNNDDGDIIFRTKTSGTAVEVCRMTPRNVTFPVNVTMQGHTTQMNMNLNVSGNATVNNLNASGTITTRNASAYPNLVVCYLAGGKLGHCTSVVGIDGSCTCVVN